MSAHAQCWLHILDRPFYNFLNVHGDRECTGSCAFIVSIITNVTSIPYSKLQESGSIHSLVNLANLVTHLLWPQHLFSVSWGITMQTHWWGWWVQMRFRVWSCASCSWRLFTVGRARHHWAFTINIIVLTLIVTVLILHNKKPFGRLMFE